MMTDDEARAYLVDHALAEKERLVYEDIQALWQANESADPQDPPLNIITVLVQFLTDYAFCKMAEDHVGDPQGCAEVAALLVQYVGALLEAKIVVGGEVLYGGGGTEAASC